MFVKHDASLPLEEEIENLVLNIEKHTLVERRIPAAKEIVRAIARGSHEILDSLVPKDNINGSMCELILRACAFFGQFELFQKFLNRSSREEFIISDCLLTAAEKGYLRLVDFILDSYKARVQAYSALCRAAENGHLEVVDCIVYNHNISPNSTLFEHVRYTAEEIKNASYPYRKGYQRSQALYSAASAGQLAVVQRLLDDPRTGYFDDKKIIYNSPDEKAYILALTKVSNALFDKNIMPADKRKILFAEAGTLLSRNQKEDFLRLLKSIEANIKSKLIRSCLGKKAPDEKGISYVYGDTHTEFILLLNHSSIKRLSDGSIQLIYDQKNKAYSLYIPEDEEKPARLDLIAEMAHLVATLGYEAILTMDAITFTPKSSLELREVNCIHYNADYLEKLVYTQNSLWHYFRFYHSLRQDSFWLQVPKEIWRLIGDFFIGVLHQFSLNTIDSSDKPALLSNPPQLLLSPVAKEPQIDKIKLCQVIYEALYKGQSSFFFFKHWNSDLMDKGPKQEKSIIDYIANNPQSRTATAWNLTNQFVDGNLTKKGLFKAIHQESYKNSSCLGIFKQSVFESGYDGFEQRIQKAKRGKLEGTRTQDIVDVLNSHPSLRL